VREKERFLLGQAGSWPKKRKVRNPPERGSRLSPERRFITTRERASKLPREIRKPYGGGEKGIPLQKKKKKNLSALKGVEIFPKERDTMLVRGGESPSENKVPPSKEKRPSNPGKGGALKIKRGEPA